MLISEKPYSPRQIIFLLSTLFSPNILFHIKLSITSNIIIQRVMTHFTYIVCNISLHSINKTSVSHSLLSRMHQFSELCFMNEEIFDFHPTFCCFMNFILTLQTQLHFFLLIHHHSFTRVTRNNVLLDIFVFSFKNIVELLLLRF